MSIDIPQPDLYDSPNKTRRCVGQNPGLTDSSSRAGDARVHLQTARHQFFQVEKVEGRTRSWQNSAPTTPR